MNVKKMHTKFDKYMGIKIFILTMLLYRMKREP